MPTNANGNVHDWRMEVRFTGGGVLALVEADMAEIVSVLSNLACYNMRTPASYPSIVLEHRRVRGAAPCPGWTNMDVGIVGAGLDQL